MEINNVISECINPNRPHSDRGRKIEGVIIHKLSSAGDDPDEYPDVMPIPDALNHGALMARRFWDTRKWRPGAYTGGKFPYQFLGRTDGQIDQCVEVSKRGAHAGGSHATEPRLNSRTIGYATLGDFDARPPTADQLEAAIRFVGIFIAMGYWVKGHDEVRDPTKGCPGRYFDLVAFRAATESIARTITDPRQRLDELGVVW